MEDQHGSTTLPGNQTITTYFVVQGTLMKQEEDQRVHSFFIGIWLRVWVLAKILLLGPLLLRTEFGEAFKKCLCLFAVWVGA